MTVAIEMGHATANAPVTLDLEELLATRLLVQGNSGSGKSHLLRRLLEQRDTVLSTQNIEAAAIASGMRTMLQDGILKVIAGETTLEEIYRVLG